MLLASFVFACALLIGFAAHRASLCNVRAVAELMTSGSAHMLWSLLQAVLWATALTGVLALAVGLSPQTAWVRTPLAWAVAGGFLFGAGAAVNGGCSLSTLTRLADGDLGMLAALAGFMVGVGAWVGVEAAGWPGGLVPVASPWLRWPQAAPWMLALLLAWGGHRALALVRLGRRHPRAAPMLLSTTWHLSVSAAVLGLAAGLLYAAEGAWSYTNYLRAQVSGFVHASPGPSVWHGVLVLALLAGMIFSARQRGSFRWRWPDGFAGWLRHCAGGMLMGAGAAMVPGGNDTLLLGGLPAMTAGAAWSYLAMLAGIALALVLMAQRIPMATLACSPEGCEETGTAARQP